MLGTVRPVQMWMSVIDLHYLRVELMSLAIDRLTCFSCCVIDLPNCPSVDAHDRLIRAGDGTSDTCPDVSVCRVLNDFDTI